jgi:hypothetical protein
MDGPDARTGPGREEGLRDHRHVDNDSVSLLHSSGFQQQSHAANGFVGLAKRPSPFFIEHVGDPYQGLLISMGGEVAVEHVVGDVGDSVREPPGEGRVVGVEDGLGEGEPLHLPRLLLPVTLPQLGGTRATEGLFVSVLSH